MYSQIDRILFPNWCEVYQTASHQYVYPIFKNASSLLKKKQKQYNWKILVNEQLKKIESIDVYLRDPFERYVSGVNSYIHWQTQDDSTINDQTLLKYIDRFPFIDRHFCPQYYWLCNLARYTDATINIRSLQDINKLTDGEFMRPHDSRGRLISEMEHMRDSKFLKLDRIIIDTFMNRKTTIQEINKNFKQNHEELYKDIFKPSNDIASQWNALD